MLDGHKGAATDIMDGGDGEDRRGHHFIMSVKPHRQSGFQHSPILSCDRVACIAVRMDSKCVL